MLKHYFLKLLYYISDNFLMAGYENNIYSIYSTLKY